MASNQNFKMTDAGPDPASPSRDKDIASDPQTHTKDISDQAKVGKRRKRIAKFISDEIATVLYTAYYPTGYVLYEVPSQMPQPAPPDNTITRKDGKLDSEAYAALEQLTEHIETHSMPKLLTTDYKNPPEHLSVCPRGEKK